MVDEGWNPMALRNKPQNLEIAPCLHIVDPIYIRGSN